MTWDGVERRKMDRDWLDRDRLLSDIHSDVKHISEWCKMHDSEDDKRFALVNKEVQEVKDFAQKHIYIGIGGLGVLMLILKVIH